MNRQTVLPDQPLKCNQVYLLCDQNMIKKDKPMLSVADIIQAQGKVWDRPFSGKCHFDYNFLSTRNRKKRINALSQIEFLSQLNSLDPTINS